MTPRRCCRSPRPGHQGGSPQSPATALQHNSICPFKFGRDSTGHQKPASSRSVKPAIGAPIHQQKVAVPDRHLGRLGRVAGPARPGGDNAGKGAHLAPNIRICISSSSATCFSVFSGRKAARSTSNAFSAYQIAQRGWMRLLLLSLNLPKRFHISRCGDNLRSR